MHIQDPTRDFAYHWRTEFDTGDKTTELVEPKRNLINLHKNKIKVNFVIQTYGLFQSVRCQLQFWKKIDRCYDW